MWSEFWNSAFKCTLSSNNHFHSFGNAYEFNNAIHRQRPHQSIFPYNGNYTALRLNWIETFSSYVVMMDWGKLEKKIMLYNIHFDELLLAFLEYSSHAKVFKNSSSVRFGILPAFWIKNTNSTSNLFWGMCSQIRIIIQTTSSPHLCVL